MGKKSNKERGLDLHGYKHSEVELIVENYVLMNKPPFLLITGHSNAMKSICKKVLDTHGFKYCLSGTFNNPGCIEIFS